MEQTFIGIHLGEKRGLTTKDELTKAVKYWSEHRSTDRARWWMNPSIIRQEKMLVCAEAIDGASTGLQHRMQVILQRRSFSRGISVRCGSGTKELQLL